MEKFFNGQYLLYFLFTLFSPQCGLTIFFFFSEQVEVKLDSIIAQIPYCLKEGELSCVRKLRTCDRRVFGEKMGKV